ncbi:MAG: hypothetical protein H9847_06885 [Candidatus Anaerobiospirillum pullicola]|uniref:Uncharacterized protein n=1 Tax=Candidatus Anaerobiospirillum pullicola TaxID=2838451 RepID=A0A948WZW3_9GAMM|nr:hypothetical protein [Candidatus Anaerobiospirillum pullicola]
MPKNSSADSDSANLGMSRTTGMSRSFARPKIVGGFAVPTTSSKSHSASSVDSSSSVQETLPPHSETTAEAPADAASEVGAHEPEAKLTQAAAAEAEPQVKPAVQDVLLSMVNQFFNLSGIDADLDAVFADFVAEKEAKWESSKDMFAKLKTLARFMMLENTSNTRILGYSQMTHAYPFGAELMSFYLGWVYNFFAHAKDKFPVFFAQRYQPHSASEILAFDVSLFAQNAQELEELRKFYGTAYQEACALRFFIFYTKQEMAPVGFAVLPRTITDCPALDFMQQSLGALGNPDCEVVADYLTDEQTCMATLEAQHLNYTLRISTHQDWVHKAIDKCEATFDGFKVLPSDSNVFGARVALTKYIKAGHPRYLYLISDMRNDVPVRNRRDALLDKLEEQLNAEEWDQDKASAEERQLVERLFEVTRYEDGTQEFFINSEERSKFALKLSVVALVSNVQRTPDEAYQLYKKQLQAQEVCAGLRAEIEPQLWDFSHECREMLGRAFTTFLAVSVLQFAQNFVQTLQNYLQEFVQKHQEQQSFHEQCAAYTELSDWLKWKTMPQILRWFAVNKEQAVDSDMARQRWSEQSRQRDQLFLAFLGLGKFPQGFKDLQGWKYLTKGEL